MSDSLVILWFRTPAPLPSTSAFATSRLLPIALRWRGSYKRKVYFDSLVKELGVMCSFDRGFGFLLRGVLDKDVALGKHACQLYFPCHMDFNRRPSRSQGNMTTGERVARFF